MIDLTSVSLRYPDADAYAIDDITLRISEGEFVFLVGPSGSGKSTLMRLLLAEKVATSGRVSVAGRNLSRIRRDRRLSAYRRSVGVVFQDHRLLPDRTAAANVAYALQVMGADRDTLNTRVPEVLGRVGLADKSDRFPAQLSGGEQQRVAIARAIAGDPVLLLADEPTGNLDPATSAEILDVIAGVNAAGTTVVMATHDTTSVDRLRRRVVEINAGQIVRDERDATYVAAAPPRPSVPPRQHRWWLPRKESTR